MKKTNSQIAKQDIVAQKAHKQISKSLRDQNRATNTGPIQRPVQSRCESSRQSKRPAAGSQKRGPIPQMMVAGNQQLAMKKAHSNAPFGGMSVGGIGLTGQASVFSQKMKVQNQGMQQIKKELPPIGPSQQQTKFSYGSRGPTPQGSNPNLKIGTNKYTKAAIPQQQLTMNLQGNDIKLNAQDKDQDFAAKIKMKSQMMIERRKSKTAGYS